MAEIGISYAHVDAPAAIAVRRALVGHGLSVWMDEADEASDNAESIGLPWGQAHWDVITAEFAAANVIVVIDTPAWRQSRYCQDEYAFVHDWGKWVEFLDADEGPPVPARIAEIVDRLTMRQAMTSAHARLMEAARTTAPRHTSRLERLLHHGEERDARLLLSSSPEVDGIAVTYRLGPYAEAAIERSRQARKRLRRLAVSTLAMLAVLALVGVTALTVTRAGERAATQSAARSQALELAARSSTEVDTNKALAQAHEADRLSPSRESTEAVNIATANNARLRTIVVGPQDYMAATWAAEAEVLVAYAGNRLTVLDAETGDQLRSITVGDSIRLGSVVVSADADLAVFVTGDGRQMQVADLNTGDVRAAHIQGVNAVTTGDGTELWWTADGGLYRGAFATLDTAAPQPYPLANPALTVAVTADQKLVDYIDSRGVLHSNTYDATSITETGTLAIVPQEPGPETPSPISAPISNPAAVADPTSSSPASLKRCGDNLFGGIRGLSALKGTTFTMIEGTLETDRQYGTPRTPVCNPDNTAWYSSVMPGGPSHTYGAAPWLPGGSERELPVTDPSNTRVSAITNNGRLYHVPTIPIESYGADGVVTMLRIGGTEYLVHADGRIVDAVSGAETGRVPSPIDTASAAAATDFGVLATQGMLWRIDAAGRATELMPLAQTSIHSIRAGSNGATFICASTDSITTIDPATGTHSRVDIDGLDSGEMPVDADISPTGDALSFVTDAGRVGTMTLSGTEVVAAPQFSGETFAMGTRTQLAYIPGTGELIVASNDGTIRLFDSNLRVTEINFFGGAVDTLLTSGRFAALNSDTLGTTVYEGSTLTALDHVPTDVSSLSSETVALEPVHSRLSGIGVRDPQTGEDSVRRYIPLPTL